jgi:hypothetical protein
MKGAAVTNPPLHRVFFPNPQHYLKVTSLAAEVRTADSYKGFEYRCWAGGKIICTPSKDVADLYVAIAHIHKITVLTGDDIPPNTNYLQSHASE